MLEMCEAACETAWRTGAMVGFSFGLALGVVLLTGAVALGRRHGREVARLRAEKQAVTYATAERPLPGFPPETIYTRERP